MPHFTQTLLDWYAQNGRDLPWRDTTDPYRIWISEIILQHRATTTSCVSFAASPRSTRWPPPHRTR